MTWYQLQQSSSASSLQRGQFSSSPLGHIYSQTTIHTHITETLLDWNEILLYPEKPNQHYYYLVFFKSFCLLFSVKLLTCELPLYIFLAFVECSFHCLLQFHISSNNLPPCCDRILLPPLCRPNCVDTASGEGHLNPQDRMVANKLNFWHLSDKKTHSEITCTQSCNTKCWNCCLQT